MGEFSKQIQQQVRDAHQSKTVLNIISSNTKSWYGRTPHGTPLRTREHTGIINYQPSELMITARAGTTLAEIAGTLDEHRQRLPFDPPYYGEDATIGGTVACNFSGPRRPYAGSCRDFMLGCTMFNGKGDSMRFGGEVMKNVAGFDVTRLMVGSLGTLGVLMDVSIKVLPHRLAEQTLTLDAGFSEAIGIMNHWAATPLPVTAMACDGRQIYFRICGTPSAVETSRKQIGGDLYEDGLNFWKDLREHSLAYFDDPRPLWRFSLPQAAPHIAIEDANGPVNEADWLIGWGGAQRWLKSELPFDEIQMLAKNAGGTASLFRNGDRESECFAPLPSALMALHRNVKHAFDPACILNPGRMYRGL